MFFAVLTKLIVVIKELTHGTAVLTDSAYLVVIRGTLNAI